MGLWNSPRRLISVIVKEYKHIWFDPGFLFLTLFSPAVLLTLLSYVFSFDVENATLAVINRDQSPQSFEYLRALTADGDVTFTDSVVNYDEALELFKAGESRASASGLGCVKTRFQRKKRDIDSPGPRHRQY